MAELQIDLFRSVHLPEMEVAALDVLRSGNIASGPKVVDFERAFAALAGREHVASTSDLTSAVTLGLHLAGVRDGDEVATIAFSCLQSNSSIIKLGARPLWIDVDTSTMSMSVTDLATKLTPSVKAVMVYHVAGYPSNIAEIAALCRDKNVPLIEDCNNAIGATANGLPVGVQGDYAVYSLYPNRQINGIDGGMLATPDAATAARAKRLRRFGIDAPTFRDSRGEINAESDVPEMGWSAALNQLNAAVALSQLDTLQARVARIHSIADRLASGLSDVRNIRVVQPLPGAIPAFWGFMILSEHRDEMLKYLKAQRIKCSVLHQRNDWYTGFGTPRADLPGTELAMAQLLALPCGWWLTDLQVDELINRLREFDAG